MKNVLIFGGTTEGRELAEWLNDRKTAEVTVSTATEYGGELVSDMPRVSASSRRISVDEMISLISKRDFACVVDATHPYAASVSKSIRAATQQAGCDLLRLLREDEPDGPWITASDAENAAKMLNEIDGNVLLTTGSKDLGVFAENVSDFFQRVYVRILPVTASIEAAQELGVKTDHIIGMQGPFSRELNVALIRDFDITALVTKASGNAGGFWEKIEAAQECEIRSIVISRPQKEEGLNFEQVKERLVSEYGF